MNDLFLEFLTGIGIQVTADMISDIFKTLRKKNQTIDLEILIKTLKEKSLITNQAQKDSVIEFFAQQKASIVIEGVEIKSPNIAYESSTDSNITINSGTTSTTDNTLIKTGSGFIRITGGASINQRN